MASWDDLIAHVRGTHPPAEIAADGAVRLRVAVDGSQRRFVSLRCHRPSGSETAWLLLSSPVGDAVRIDLLAASKHAEGHVVGNVALEGGSVVLRHAVPLEYLEIDAFETLVRSLAWGADTIAHAINGMQRR